MLVEENLEPCLLAKWSGEKWLSLILPSCIRPFPMNLPPSHQQLRETGPFTLEEKNAHIQPFLAHPSTSTETFLL